MNLYVLGPKYVWHDNKPSTFVLIAASSLTERLREGECGSKGGVVLNACQS